MTKTWGKVGRELAEKLDGLTNEADIKALGGATIQEILKQETTSEARMNALKLISRELLKRYPRAESPQSKSYWHDAGGKTSLPKWRHAIFKYLTFGRKEHQAEVIETKPERITMNQLDLDIETQDILEAALNHSGMELQDFIKQAIKVYAKTITGKSKKHSEDLSAVATGELLTDSKYKTHPGRATELTKRAIQAIKIYNSEIAAEPADRWMITASAIASLIGSRQSTIKEIMQQFQTSIDENNLNPEWNLTPYSNRKPGQKIDDAIHLSGLMPDGLS
jgi:hypothetical protein